MRSRANLGPYKHSILGQGGISMKKTFIRLLSIGLTVLCLCLLVINPLTAAEAVKKALGICSGVILPSLLPFFFISGIISALGIPQLLARSAQRPLQRLFSISGWACTPLLLGLLCGYPVGAAALTELREQKKISRSEAEILLPICNNTGPAFIIGAVGGGIFFSNKAGIILYCAHILSALILALLFAPNTSMTDINIVLPMPDDEYESIVSALPKSIKSAVEKSLSICGFVIFFSILSSLLDALGILSSSALFISRLFDLEIGFCKSLLTGILELGGGIASMRGLSLTPLNLALSAFILGFGSLSVHCQTLAVVFAAKIKCARHFVGRIIHGLISAIIVFVAATLFKI